MCMVMASAETVDWTFQEIKTNPYTHGIHQYPARMHPEIAKRIIQKYASDSKSVILDPFMGSGGVLVEALLHGNNSIGIDLNPFAVLLSKVKTTPINPEKLENVFKVILDVIKKDSKDKVVYQNFPDKLDLEFWYPKDPIQKLPILKNSINQIKDKGIRNFFLICFSLTIRRTSFQKNSSYKIHRMKPEQRDKFSPDTFKKFTEICQRNIHSMDEFYTKTKKQNLKALTILGDSRNLSEIFDETSNKILDEGKDHLVVTSPPYGDHGTTVAYGQFSKHLGLWLDLKEKKELLTVDSKGLGGTKIDENVELDSPLLDQVLKKNNWR